MSELLTDAERAERAAIKAAEIKRDTDLEVQRREVPVKLAVAVIAALAVLIVGVSQCAKSPNTPMFVNTNNNGTINTNTGAGNATVNADANHTRGTQ